LVDQKAVKEKGKFLIYVFNKDLFYKCQIRKYLNYYIYLKYFYSKIVPPPDIKIFQQKKYAKHLKTFKKLLKPKNMCLFPEKHEEMFI